MSDEKTLTVGSLFAGSEGSSSDSRRPDDSKHYGNNEREGET